jgi:uncharacterized protein YfaS (alpha-2-macroglobulin family)
MSNLTSSNPRAGSRRFWIAILCFAILNAAAWVAYDRWFAWRHLGTLRVDAFEPGDGSVVGPREQFRWHFSADVIPTSVYHADPGSVAPAVAGHWGWDDPRTLCFTPDSDLPRATQVSFTLATALLRSDTGASLPGPCVDTVRSTPLQLEDARQAGIENDRYVLELRFNDRVAPGDVMQHLTLTDPNGSRINCELVGQAADKIVRVQTDSIPAAMANDKRDGSDTRISLHLSSGLAGLSGPLGMADDQMISVSLVRRLSATGLEAFVPARGQPELRLNFNNAIDLATAKQVISVDPPVAFTCSSNFDSQIVLTGEFKPETRYTVTLAAGPAGVDAARYPRPGRLTAFVGDHERGVWFDNDEGYLSSKGNRTLVAHAMNVDEVHLSITRVYDDNLVAWRNAASGRRWTDVNAFARPLVERTIHLPNQKNVQHDLPIELDDLLPASPDRDGVYRVAVEMSRQNTGAEDDSDDDDEFGGSRASSLVTLSDIGLTAKRTRDGIVVWAASLRSAEPMAGVRARVYSDKNQLLGEATTDAEGIATISGVHPAKGETAAVVLADQIPAVGIEPLGPAMPTTEPSATAGPRAATGLTWLDLRRSSWDLGDADTGGRAYLRSGYEAFVYTDRGVYRPGETVHLRAIVRSPDGSAPAGTFPVVWQFRRPDHHQWINQTVMLDADGAAAADVALPSDLVTGNWSASIGLPGGSESADKSFGSASFGVEEFVPNRMKVRLFLPGESGSTSSASDASTPRFGIEGIVKTAVQADYLFGRPAANLPVELTVRAEPSVFAPAKWTGWTFGSPKSDDVPHHLHRGPADGSDAKSADDTPDTTLDENGHYVWKIDAAKIIDIDPKTMAQASVHQFTGPWRLIASAAVREAGGRAVTVIRQMEIDALPAYIGARCADAATPRPGEPCALQICLVRTDGAPAADNSDALQCTLSRVSWNTVLSFENGRYHYNSTRVLEPLKSGTVQLAAGCGTWRPILPSDGDYEVNFRDSRSGASTTIALSAEDGSPWDDNVDRANPEHVDLQFVEGSDGKSPAKGQATSKYRIGEMANVLISSPFAGRLLLTVETDNVLKTTVLDMAASHVIVPVQITEAMRPNAFVCASIVRPIDPQAKWRTHRAFGMTRLRVDPGDRQLHVAIIAPPEIRPQRTLDVALRVTDGNGQAVANAAITVAAVDEGICSLTDFVTPDPLKFFQGDRALGVGSGDVYSLLMPEVARPDKTSSPGGDASEAVDARRHSPVVARRFVPVALAWQLAHSGGDGTARVSFAVPEFEGRLRVMAVAYEDRSVGSSDVPVTVRSPILAQTSWPRFAAPGDRFTVPIVLFNNTSQPGSAIVNVQLLGQNAATNLLGFGSDQRPAIELPPMALGANGQRQIDLPVSVGQAAGVAAVRLTASMNGETFEENVELPVRPPSPTMQFGGYIAASTTQPTVLDNMQRLLPGTEAMNVRVTPWPTLRLPQGLDYLDRYPYGCVEQTTSALFPLITLGDIGKQIDPVRFDPQRMKETINTGIMHLIGMQTPDSGLAMWPGETTPWQWGTVYAADFLVEARAAGYDVPDDFYGHTLSYVRRMLDRTSDNGADLESQAYAAYVLALAGTPPRAAIDRLTELTNTQRNDSSDFDDVAMRENARMMLACAWMLTGRHDIADGMIPQTLPVPRLHRQRDGEIGSPIRDRAMLIDTLAMVQPANPALPALVQQLADDGGRGNWASTQDAAFAVMAIGRYLKIQQNHEPYDDARLLAGTRLLAEASGGASLAWDAPASVEPPATQANAPQMSVQLSGSPQAVGYVSWLQTGVPLQPPADASHGIEIHRRYLTPEGREISHNTIRSGDLVLVEITLRSSVPETGLAIEDMLPAGLEIENARLSTSAKKSDQVEDNTRDLPEFAGERMDARDDRMVIIGSMPAATARCSYLARAVTPGVYVLPPARVEAMYDINTNATCGGGGQFIVTSATASLADAGIDP